MSHLTLTRIAAQLFNTPLLLVPETAVAIAANLSERFGIEPMAGADDPLVIEASRFRGTPAVRREDGRTLYRTEGGVAVIPVLGELVNRGAWIGASSGLTSYEGLDAQLRAAAADPSVTGILLDLNSPGGEASGAMEIGTLVRELSADKPVVAFVNGQASSAGYAIAAGARTIVVTPSALVGSIGVVMLHLDRSAALAKAGVKPTLLHAGAHKVDGSSLQALPDEARSRIQASIDGLYDLFTSHVAALRGLDVEAVRQTEGGVLMGRAAVAAGLADKVGTFDDALAILKPKTKSQGAFLMTDITRADHEAALRAAAEQHTSALVTATTAARAEAVAADRARMSAILGHEEAKGREAQANHLAFHTTMSVDEAAALMKVSAKASATHTNATRSRLGVPDPDIKPEDGGPSGKGADASWDGVVSELNAAR